MKEYAMRTIDRCAANETRATNERPAFAGSLVGMDGSFRRASMNKKLWLLAVVSAALNVSAVTAEDGPDDTRYTVHNVSDNTSRTVTGAELQKCLCVKVASNKRLRLKVTLEK
jgi:hypothetical protein